jgi:tocopherol cyclase
MGAFERLDRVFRRSGATLPLGDPRPSHGAEMEGYFWRVTDTATRRVLVVLCGVNRHPDGDWATVAIAAEPGGFVRSAVLPGAHAAAERFSVTAGDGAFVATASEVHVDLGEDARVDLSLHRPVPWPYALGGGGVFSTVPFLGQYWHPHLLGGGAAGVGRVGAQTWEFTDAEVYAEKNWGAGFPRALVVGAGAGLRPPRRVRRLLRRRPHRWAAVRDGGRRGRAGRRPGGPADAPAGSRQEPGGRQRWEVRARGLGYRVHIVGSARGPAHVLPVPLPAERRNVDTDFEHLAGHLTLEVDRTAHLPRRVRPRRARDRSPATERLRHPKANSGGRTTTTAAAHRAKTGR